LVIRLPDGAIYVAADSLQIDPEAGFARNYCKINKTGSMYWVAATNFYTHTTTGFDLESLVSSIGTDGTLLVKMERFIKIAEPAMESEVTSTQTEAPSDYASYIAGKMTPLQISFIKVERGRPVFVFTDFAISKVKGRIVARATHPIKPPIATKKYPISMKPLGDYALALRYLKNHYDELIKTPPAVIKAAINIEERAHPERVGGPISILRVDRYGAKWIEQGKCQQPQQR
jgi:hypothetical protein